MITNRNPTYRLTKKSQKFQKRKQIESRNIKLLQRLPLPKEWMPDWLHQRQQFINRITFLGSTLIAQERVQTQK